MRVKGNWGFILVVGLIAWLFCLVTGWRPEPYRSKASGTVAGQESR